MKTSTRVIIFLALIIVYVGLVVLTGAKFELFTNKYRGLGIDFYVIGDYIACFYTGPAIGPLDPYPFRKTMVFLGGLIMASDLFFKLLIR